MKSPEETLSSIYASAMSKASGKQNIESSLNECFKEKLNIILEYSESAKAVLTVLLTSLVYKHLNPGQDVRKHQQSIKGGYSGRTFDTKYITPFLREKRFPAMASSGWLTRSLEQKVPYDYNYTGAIKPDKLKLSFLSVLDDVETGKVQPIALLDYLFQGLIIERDKQDIPLARPQNLSIENIITLLDSHFHSKYRSEGASRLPVLAIYAVYQCLVKELKRFESKILLPLESHTSADSRSGRIGDIDIVDGSGRPFEAVEVKFDIPINHEIVQIAIEKLGPTAVERYYVLSTSEVYESDKDKIAADIKQVKNTHGCQLVVNGIMTSLKYYLRLINDTKVFIGNYVDLLQSDKSIKFEHKSMWNKLISEL